MVLGCGKMHSLSWQDATPTGRAEFTKNYYFTWGLDMSKKSYSPVSIAMVPFLFVMVLSVVVSVFFWGCSSGGGG